ncbi:MAG: terminase [Lachnospiraceae bacterium]|nr:terminase [Lachnospiraceae bacterium]
MDKIVKNNKSYIYAKAITTKKFKNINIIKELKDDYIPPKYVIKQCKQFVDICEEKSEKYTINVKLLNRINQILRIMYMPKMAVGKTVYDTLTDYQWLVIVATFCVVYREDLFKRKHQKVILEIARKNFKTFTVAIIFILSMLFEPQFSKMFSVAPDGKLSKEVKDAIDGIIKTSPVLYGEEKKRNFKILRDSVRYLIKDTEFIPLNYTNSKFDGKQPNVFLADEVGALPNNYAIEAMQSGQLQLQNKLGCVVSTKYPNDTNPFEDEVAYAKSVLDENIQDETLFSLLYEPDETKGWETNDCILMQSNPAVIENGLVWDTLLKKRTKAILIQSARENFLTKHCNIIYQSQTENYVNIELVKKCKVKNIDWTGRDVFVGVDLAQSNDNVAISIVSVDGDIILGDSFAFIPEGKIEEKIATENVDYIELCKSGKCFACGDMVIDYSAVEDFVFNIENMFKCHIVGIGYDRYNAISSAEKWRQKYQVVEVKQHSSVLHPATKLLQEKIESKEFQYTENKLLEINFNNAQCQYDTNLNKFVTKRKSTGKVDMVVALINAVHLAQQDIIFGDNWGAMY